MVFLDACNSVDEVLPGHEPAFFWDNMMNMVLKPLCVKSKRRCAVIGICDSLSGE